MTKAAATPPVEKPKRTAKRAACPMTYEQMFKKVQAAFSKRSAAEIKEHLALQFNITGEGEGAFYVEVINGALRVEPYEYYDRSAILTCTAATALQLAGKKLDPDVACLSGALCVTGDYDKAMTLKRLL